jgi:hypothetical protein
VQKPLQFVASGAESFLVGVDLRLQRADLPLQGGSGSAAGSTQPLCLGQLFLFLAQLFAATVEGIFDLLRRTACGLRVPLQLVQLAHRHLSMSAACTATMTGTW